MHWAPLEGHVALTLCDSQQWLLGYEFPSTLILFGEDKVTILCSASKAKILSQIEGTLGPVPVEILAQAKKEQTNDSLDRFFQLYASKKRAADSKPELVDMGPALSTFMAVKDAEELETIQMAGNLTSTLLKHYVVDKLESILDKESKITHEVLVAQIEARLGSGEGANAKPPDPKVWSKGKGLIDVDWALVEFCYPPIIISRSSNTGYDLRYTAESTDESIVHKGVFLVFTQEHWLWYTSINNKVVSNDPFEIRVNNGANRTTNFISAYLV
ncbi:FACT complex subunit SPT16 N-terminal lobe domain-containing protein [Roridomyces roridus]|uniref:FACT complex subunit n=1 Tax=Roridomyces roridus TaxID=1738132 RepID=A0AAD7B1K1_9AGAR|nr:FACT complex subunit SPT16 N-terminal lobe domain-containing protein [Roridomyces roridus]